MDLSRKITAEFLGTFWLVLGGCGSAVLAAGIPDLGIGYAGVSLAFGLTVLTAAYALGPISGGHFNPAVTAGLTAAGKFPLQDLVPYWIAQVLGAIAGASIIFIIASGAPNFSPGGFAANGFGAHSPHGYSMSSAAVTEIVLTFMFLIVILGATAKNASPGFGGLAIGLSLTLIHLISIPVTNTSVNPARSTGQVFFADSWATDQLWLFWVAPLIGAILAGLVWRWLGDGK